jgi:hypothetical protein
MQQTYNLPDPVVAGDGPGKRYALHLQQLARDDPQYFICHYYNFFFAHTAGGRMIGTKVCACCRGTRLNIVSRWHRAIMGSGSAMGQLQEKEAASSTAPASRPAGRQAGRQAAVM